jgi:hypothetical protein
MVAFLIISAPLLLLRIVEGTVTDNSPWVNWAGSAWARLLQGLASVVLISSSSKEKPDIKNAVVSFLCCRQEAVTEAGSTEQPSTEASLRLFKRFSFIKSMLSLNRNSIVLSLLLKLMLLEKEFAIPSDLINVFESINELEYHAIEEFDLQETESESSKGEES